MEAYICKVGDSSSTTINATRVQEFLAKGYIEMVEENLDPTMVAQADGTWALSPELLFAKFTSKTDEYIQAKIEEYNTANGVKFSDINTFPKYAMNTASEHNLIANKFITWVDLIWKEVRAITVVPTDEEFTLILDAVVF